MKQSLKNGSLNKGPLTAPDKQNSSIYYIKKLKLVFFISVNKPQVLLFFYIFIIFLLKKCTAHALIIQ